MPPPRCDEDFLDPSTLDSEPVDREVIDQLVTQDTANNIAERPQAFGFHALDSQKRVSPAWERGAVKLAPLRPRSGGERGAVKLAPLRPRSGGEHPIPRPVVPVKGVVR